MGIMPVVAPASGHHRRTGIGRRSTCLAVGPGTSRSTRGPLSGSRASAVILHHLGDERRCLSRPRTETADESSPDRSFSG